MWISPNKLIHWTLIGLLGSTSLTAHSLLFSRPPDLSNPEITNIRRDLLRTIQTEPVWPSLARDPEHFAALWSAKSAFFEKFPLADSASIFELQNAAALVWADLLRCNGDSAEAARKQYLSGDLCLQKSAAEIAKSKIRDLLESLWAYLNSTHVNPNEDPSIVNSYWYPNAIPSSPFFNQLLMEIHATTSIFPETLDKKLLRLFRNRRITAEEKRALIQRTKIAEMAARTLYITTKECEDFGLWPTISGSLFAFSNMTYAFLETFKPEMLSTETASRASVANMMSCGEYLIKNNPAIYEEFQERIRHFKWDDDGRGVEFYRFLEQRNHKWLENKSESEKSKSPKTQASKTR